MRGLSIGVAIVSVLVFAGGAAPAHAAGEEASLAPEAAPQADYYTRRAESVIKAEKKAATAPHPLAAAHPGFDIVVCEAGCPVGQTPEIVFAKRETEREKATTQGEMITTSSDASAKPVDAAESNLACIAGCYDKTAAAEMRDDASTPWSVSIAPADAAPEKPAPAPLRDKLSPIR